jgi:hypothetical protein
VRYRRHGDTGLLVPSRELEVPRRRDCMGAMQQALLYGGVTNQDPYSGNVKSLAHFEGTDGATSTTDEVSGVTWSTFSGNAQIDTAQSRAGSSSLLLDGSGDKINSNYVAGFDINGDMTVDISVRAVSWATTNYICSRWAGTGSSNDVFVMYYQSGTRFGFDCRDIDGTTYRSIGVNVSGGISTGAWHDLAVSRVGNVFYFFVDGTLVGSQTLAFTINKPSTGIYMGSDSAGTSGVYFNGWLDEFRYTVGTGRYTSAYTPSLPFAYP